MDPALVTATATALGSVVGAAASIATTWLAQRTQAIRASAEWKLREREALYREFITEASRAALDALMNSLVRRGGTIALNGLPPGSFPLPIFQMVLDGITVRGSIVGTRLDLQEALAMAGGGAVKATVETARLEDVNEVFARMRVGQIEGRVVLDFGQ
jgi:propanol-preferring alcohol dehydrogenase